MVRALVIGTATVAADVLALLGVAVARRLGARWRARARLPALLLVSGNALGGERTPVIAESAFFLAGVPASARRDEGDAPVVQQAPPPPPPPPQSPPPDHAPPQQAVDAQPDLVNVGSPTVTPTDTPTGTPTASPTGTPVSTLAARLLSEHSFYGSARSMLGPASVSTLIMHEPAIDPMAPFVDLPLLDEATVTESPDDASASAV